MYLVELVAEVDGVDVVAFEVYKGVQTMSARRYRCLRSSRRVLTREHDDLNERGDDPSKRTERREARERGVSSLFSFVREVDVRRVVGRTKKTIVKSKTAARSTPSRKSHPEHRPNHAKEEG
jgi:CRISPR/Cas system CSM-associated protein Csm5 (group 7 of RAMP superfamily)